ncbi:MAG TPA: GntR family transcriptional regulator [Bacteroidales bacterium]|nr:GntR family transcriptional regulator [Bacteroidales bacterium]
MKYAIDHKSMIPLHAQVETLLRKMAEDPEYKSGKLLPNEVDLAKNLGISRNTLRQATNKLVYEGVLVRKKGFGTHFAGESVNTRIRSWSSFSQEMQAMGIDIKNFEISVDNVMPEPDVARFFNITEDTKILKLVRLRGREDGPFVYFYSYFNPRIGLTGNEDFTKPLYEILEHDYHTVAKLSKEELSARAADKFLASKLGIKVGDPILKRKRMVYDPGSRPVEYNVGYYRADSFVYTIESERE